MRESRFECSLGFAEVSAEREISRGERAALERAFTRNLRIFRRRPPPFRIFICDSKPSWKRCSKYYYFPHAVGVVLRDGTMNIKSRGFTGASAERFFQVAAHEMNHVFWLALRRSPAWSPHWLCEALACMAGKNDYILAEAALRRTRRADLPLPFRYRASLTSSREEIIQAYSRWTRFAESLCGGDPRRLVLFLESLPRRARKRAYDAAFAKRYGARDAELFARFMDRRC